ncbi:MAG: hypothetical protein AMJ65_09715 [Phycisphaerae bacterium SG8_4]|nr:MAG: hypothetical protein AMJ65_09715 [Phycisphaerae bacterium SG8_4]
MNKKWPTLGDFIIWAVVLFIVAIVLTAQCGCKTTDPKTPCPEPTPTVITETVIVPCTIRIEPLSPYTPPEYPQHPGHDVEDAELKFWALALGEAIEADDALVLARELAWQEIIEEHNSGPVCE